MNDILKSNIIKQTEQDSQTLDKTVQTNQYWYIWNVFIFFMEFQVTFNTNMAMLDSQQYPSNLVWSINWLYIPTVNKTIIDYFRNL